MAPFSAENRQLAIYSNDSCSTVAPEVAGSNPVIHPKYLLPSLQQLGLRHLEPSRHADTVITAFATIAVPHPDRDPVVTRAPIAALSAPPDPSLSFPRPNLQRSFRRRGHSYRAKERTRSKC